MKTKTVPAIIMLLGCAVASIVMYINGYEFGKMLKVLLCVLVLFLILGLIVKIVIDKNIPIPEEEEEISEDGEVIEKQSEDEDGEDASVDEDGAVVQASSADEE